MRETYNSQIIMNGDSFQGINLGADYCAEHEWGIEPLRKAFGMCSRDDYDKIVGINRFKATKVPPIVELVTFQNRKLKYVSLLVLSYMPYLSENVSLKSYVAYPYGRSDGFTYAAWDKEGFTITVPYEKREYLYALKKAIEEKNVAIYMEGIKNPFGRAGLCVMLLSEIPEVKKEKMQEKHNDENKLLEAAYKTGIVEILTKAGKKWFALAPAWKETITEFITKTKYPVIFFLNPEEQNKYNFGWFTVEELKEWAKDKGPIVKK